MKLLLVHILDDWKLCQWCQKVISASYSDDELEACDREAVRGGQGGGEVTVEAALHVDHVHLQGEGHPIVRV